ncbi:MAG: DUF3793 family protein [Ruminococcus sp.]|nr:DUF3793 family protein [Ruminococcus sp.]
MSEEAIVKYCSPTLAGLKTGSMFSCSYNNQNELFGFLRELNLSLGCKGIRFLPLRLKNKKALIYAFRPSRLFFDLKEKEARGLLTERGYCTENCGKCLSRLIKRLEEGEEFPHEIGLFLGYPVEDVKGFIENNAACAKCAGCWKVYGDEEKARKLFEQYRKCTRVYEKQWYAGKPLTKLAVAG